VDESLRPCFRWWTARRREIGWPNFPTGHANFKPNRSRSQPPFTPGGYLRAHTCSAIDVQSLLAESFDLPAPTEPVDEATFLRQLADVVDYWMQHRMEQLMSLCYTLDVSEERVADAFHPNAPEPANLGLARLLLSRQLRRLETKRTIKAEPLDDEDAW
jgi:hypothetical protein